MAKDHYTGAAGAAYHAQRAQGRSQAGQASRSAYFENLSRPVDVALDFGCATGAVLASLPAAYRIGVEVNETASREARQALDRVVADLSEIEDESVDVVISFHAIEHVPDPYSVLLGLRRVLKPGGRARVIVPLDNPLLNQAHRAWSPADKDMHLYTWTPLALGNLFTVAGFEVEAARVSHWASPGRLGRLVGEPARWIRAIRGGRLQTIVDARRP